MSESRRVRAGQVQVATHTILVIDPADVEGQHMYVNASVRGDGDGSDPLTARSDVLRGPVRDVAVAVPTGNGVFDVWVHLQERKNAPPVVTRIEIVLQEADA